MGKNTDKRLNSLERAMQLHPGRRIKLTIGLDENKEIKTLIIDQDTGEVLGDLPRSEGENHIIARVIKEAT